MMASHLVNRKVSIAARSPCARRAAPCVLQRHRIVARATQLTPQDLQARLQQKEQQLARMFESGRPMPKASEVAAIRSDIDNLRAAIEGRAQYTPPPAGAPPSRSPPSAAASAPTPPPYSGDNNLAAGNSPFSSTPPPPPPGSMPPPPAVDPFAGLEAAIKSNQGMGTIDDAEIARLEAENTVLRAQAHKLLTRQAQLEQLMAEARGDKEPELLLETTQDLLSRMKTKLKKADLSGAARFAPGAPGMGDAAAASPAAAPKPGSMRPPMPPMPPRK